MNENNEQHFKNNNNNNFFLNEKFNTLNFSHIFFKNKLIIFLPVYLKNCRRQRRLNSQFQPNV